VGWALNSALHPFSVTFIGRTKLPPPASAPVFSSRAEMNVKSQLGEVLMRSTGGSWVGQYRQAGSPPTTALPPPFSKRLDLSVNVPARLCNIQNVYMYLCPYMLWNRLARTVHWPAGSTPGNRADARYWRSGFKREFPGATQAMAAESGPQWAADVSTAGWLLRSRESEGLPFGRTGW